MRNVIDGLKSIFRKCTQIVQGVVERCGVCIDTGDSITRSTGIWVQKTMNCIFIQ